MAAEYSPRSKRFWASSSVAARSSIAKHDARTSAALARRMTQKKAAAWEQRKSGIIEAHPPGALRRGKGKLRVHCGAGNACANGPLPYFPGNRVKIMRERNSAGPLTPAAHWNNAPSAL